MFCVNTVMFFIRIEIASMQSCVGVNGVNTGRPEVHEIR